MVKTAESVGAEADVEQTGKYNGTREVLVKAAIIPLIETPNMFCACGKPCPQTNETNTQSITFTQKAPLWNLFR